jgi:hypothetical protein
MSVSSRISTDNLSQSQLYNQPEQSSEHARAPESAATEKTNKTATRFFAFCGGVAVFGAAVTGVTAGAATAIGATAFTSGLTTVIGATAATAFTAVALPYAPIIAAALIALGIACLVTDKIIQARSNSQSAKESPAEAPAGIDVNDTDVIRSNSQSAIEDSAEASQEIDVENTDVIKAQPLQITLKLDIELTEHEELRLMGEKPLNWDEGIAFKKSEDDSYKLELKDTSIDDLTGIQYKIAKYNTKTGQTAYETGDNKLFDGVSEINHPIIFEEYK